MAESPLTVPRDSQGNIPRWVLIGGGIVAALALYSFAKNKQTGVGGSTVAAGTSINAALGSLQEEVLNAQGDIQKQITDTSTATDLNVNTQVGELGASQGAANANLYQTITQSSGIIQGQINDATTQELSAQHVTAAATGTF